MCHNLTTATISTVFTETVQERSGRVMETFNDGSRLLMRSLLPFVEEVRPKDRLQGGLALRATEEEIWLHPFLFRQVCRNGAIMAHSLESLHVESCLYAAEDDVLRSLRDAIDLCSQEDVFKVAVEDIRLSVGKPLDQALSMMSFVSQWRDAIPIQLLFEIFERFSADREQTRFSLMNAITSVARDTRDPEQRWRLEELGGGIGAGLLPKPSSDGGRAKTLVQDFVPVG